MLSEVYYIMFNVRNFILQLLILDCIIFEISKQFLNFFLLFFNLDFLIIKFGLELILRFCEMIDLNKLVSHFLFK